jgi:hypothetical protein
MLMFEAAFVAISLVSPITPSKTGSDRGIAHAFIESPSYLEEVAVSFLAVSFLALHVLVLVLAVVVVIVSRVQRARE